MMVGLAVTVAVGLIGPAVALWPEGISLMDNVNTGNMTGSILFTKVGNEDNILTQDEAGGMFVAEICFEDGAGEQGITIGLNEETDEINTVCNPEIENQGTIPVRFLAPDITADDALEVEFNLPDRVMKPGQEGLDPDDSVEGQLNLGLNTNEPGTYTFRIDIKCIQWNAYDDDPGWWSDTLHIYGTVAVEEPPDSIF